MYTCDECADLLLDFLYGLVEAGEVQRLSDHLADCASCRAALARAQAQQVLLARAARVARAVPAFVAPAESGIKELSASQAPEHTLALPAAASPALATRAAPMRRPSRRWPWLATAAALLLLVGGLYWSYEQGLERRQAELARAKREVQAVEARLVSTTHAYEQDLAHLPAQLQARAVRVRITGPAAYQADAPGQVHVVTQDAHGAPTAAHLQVGVLDQAGNKMVFLQDFASPGEKAIVLPAGLNLKPGEDAQLVVKAATSRGGEAELRERLATAGPAYETHVVLNKPTYRAGEVVLFRTLTLDRFSMKPPGRDIPLTFTLWDAHHGVVKQMQGKAGPDGIGGGEFALQGLPAGADYVLEVTSAAFPQGTRERIQPRAYRFTIVRDEPAAMAGGLGGGTKANQFYFERNTYGPGDKVRGEFRQLGKGGANQSVEVNARQANGQAIPLEGAPTGRPLRTNTDAQGRASFGLQLPKDIGQGRPPIVEVEVADGKAKARYQQAIPVAPSGPAVEFYPEGGDLMAGVPNRVYYLAVTPQAARAELNGRVVDGQGREVARVPLAHDKDRPGPNGIGSFTFTPQAAESYTLRVPLEPQTQKVLPLPPVHTAGVALSVPEGVSREGEPIRVLVRSSALDRRLLLLATCRGHVVDQRFVSASLEGTDVRLSPVPGTRGVVRVTAYEIRQDQLLPRAERLVYQIPAQRLVLSCDDVAKGSERTYRPGEHVNLAIKVVDEKGEPANATLLAAVVDRRALPPGQPEQGPPAYFYLTADVPGGADLDNADFLVSDTPEARAALDLFLGTQGWRRFSEPQAPPVLAKAVELDDAAKVVERPAVFNRDNFDQVADHYDQELVRARDHLRQQALQERAALQDERERCMLAVGLATSSIGDYQERPRRILRLAVGVGVLLLLAAGCVLLLVGLLQAVRGRRPGVAFVGAFAALVLCLGIFGASGGWRQEDRGEGNDGLRAAAPERKPPPLPEAMPPAADKLNEKGQASSVPVGRFAEPQDPKRALASVDEALQERATGGSRDQTMRAESLRRFLGEEQLAKAKAVGAKTMALPQAAKGDLARTKKEQSKPENQMPPPASAFAPAPSGPSAAMSITPGAKTAADPGTNPPTLTRNNKPNKTAPLPGASTADNGDRASPLAMREYANRGGRRLAGISSDTLLWYPALLAADGTARIAFDLSGQATTYRILLYAHSPSGRQGVYRGQIETRK